MRSAKEILFRLRQEGGNLRLWALPPAVDVDAVCPLPSFPDPVEIAQRLRNTALRGEIRRLAGQVMEGRLPLLGGEIQIGETVHWRRDDQRGVETGLVYFRRIPYLDVSRAGDHKLIWELNRHQHLVLLAQEFVLGGDALLLAEIERQFKSWQRANPYQCGINWASALEVAFRALSWIWILHLAGGAMEPSFRRAILGELYRHGRHLELNLSLYFSPNTHLLGEAVMLHALGCLFPQFPDSKKWVETGGGIVERQLDAQVRADGSHFEQSSFYHVYTLDMFVFHGLVAGMSEQYRSKLARMAEYLRALCSPWGTLPLIGDDDGGRFFFPYGDRRLFGRATLATCAAILNRPDLMLAPEYLHEQACWWLRDLRPPPAMASPGLATLFADAGLAVFRCGQSHIVFDAGGFGAGSAGHSHSDALSLVVHSAGEEILIDPGTYTYVGDPAWRDRFRGTAAHNTVRIDGWNQAATSGPFRWTGMGSTTLERWSPGNNIDTVTAVCEYAGFRHRRTCLFQKPDCLWILDEIEGPSGEHLIEQFWHPGEPVKRLSASEFLIGSRSVLALSGEASLEQGGEFGWRSGALMEKHEAPLIRAMATVKLPWKMAAIIDLQGGWRAAPRPDAQLFLKDLSFPGRANQAAESGKDPHGWFSWQGGRR